MNKSHSSSLCARRKPLTIAFKTECQRSTKPTVLCGLDEEMNAFLEESHAYCYGIEKMIIGRVTTRVLFFTRNGWMTKSPLSPRQA